MGNLGIDGNAKSYGVGHLGVVQEFWDKEFPSMYRIVAFDMVAGLKPVFKGKEVRKYEVCKHKIRPNLPRYRIVAYDLETTLVNGEHQPNLVSAAVTCSVCVGEEKECEICGEGPKMITWSQAEGVIDPTSSFVDWVMGFKDFETVAFAHYAGRFDSHFVLRELTIKGIKTDMLMADLKIYQIKAGKVFFRDFWMLSQNRLADLPNTLELDIPAKLMYNENYETEFELGDQLKVYCENDVEILMAAVLKFRKLFLDITKDMDVIKDSVTIAGIVMKVFRAKFLKERHIPIVPEGGYEKADKQSKIAVRYFEWLAFRDGECDVKEELKRNREMKRFFEGVPDKGTKPEDVPYDGLLKVKVVPPKDLMYPLLPLHLDDMLLFINCGVCAKKAKKEFVRAGDVEKCAHSDEERALLGTFTSIELRKALELGYKDDERCKG
uniref:DNA-directed DNA polymerase n=1 Tax=Globodera pallida TaxID=36090 RepID=A0A183C8N4_GLOPA